MNIDQKEITFILQEGEGFRVEFKEGPGGVDKDKGAFTDAERGIGGIGD